MSSLLDQFYAIQDEIDHLIDVSDKAALDQQAGERVSFENSYFDITAQAEELIKDPPPVPAQPNVAQNSQNGNSSNNSLSTNDLTSLQNIQLPKINLPTFSGMHEAWLEFRDKYLSLIHTNTTISEIQKFHYLRATLIGEAASILQSVEFSATNYSNAWKLVCARYDNPRVLLNNHLKAIFDLESVHRESATKLRSFLDNLTKNLNALTSLKTNANLFDCLIIFIAASKLDEVTSRDWESQIKADKLPTLDELKTFLQNKCNFLSTLELSRSNRPTDNVANKIKTVHKQSHQQSQPWHKQQQLKVNSATIHNSLRCPICKQDHYLRNCSQFLNLAPNERKQKIAGANRCINCFRFGHQVNSCTASTCRVCGAKHHTLLHGHNNDTNVRPQGNALSTPAIGPLAAETQISSHHGLSARATRAPIVLLSTAIFLVTDTQNKTHQIRALLDNGSQANFITQTIANKLGLNFTDSYTSITGIGNSKSQVQSKCTVSFASRDLSFSSKVDCLVIPRITEPIPSIYFNKARLQIPKQLFLADPNFNSPATIDILLGAEFFFQYLSIGQHHLSEKGPVLQKTKFGWIISGSINPQLNQSSSQCLITTLQSSDDNSLSQFWKIEEIPSSISSLYSDEDLYCESLFTSTTRRGDNGRFIVQIPTHSLAELGNSYEQALRRFYHLERKLKYNHELRDQYCKFIDEYRSLGHMNLISAPNDQISHFYLPHHAVLNERSSTTKLRVVFDGSAQTTTSKSLNQCQYVGPSLQNDMWSILLRFRKYKFVVTADVEKMYRQIEIVESQRPLQRILWRSNPSEPIQIFELNTVTYGTASAPYLALRCLRQLADDYSHKNQFCASRIKKDFYVDDLISGADTIPGVRDLCTHIDKALRAGGFKLRKWTTNDDRIFYDSNSCNLDFLDFGEQQNSKALGLLWNPTSDCFLFRVDSKIQDKISVTKRTILSTIAQIFDPLGFLASTLIVAKILIQRLWSAKIDWDESVPRNIHYDWLKFRNSLHLLNDLRIHRHGLVTSAQNVELHGFSDASEKAYGASVYVRCTDAAGTITSSLLTAKSKVAPLHELTIPRLELCGALTLAKLVAKIISEMECEFHSITLWTDSTIVLCWLNTSAQTLKQFVANRVSEIRNLVPNTEWRHIPTTDNPADLLTRGIFPQDLVENELWWHGPSWLIQNQISWPNSSYNVPNLPETKQTVQSFLTLTEQPQQILNFQKYSSLRKLENILIYIKRFISNCRVASRQGRRHGPISVQEREETHLAIIKEVQFNAFSQEIQALSQNQGVSPTSTILALSPFLDERQILRVGGRLANRTDNFDMKHPILLPRSHHITNLILHKFHVDHCHVGPLGLLNAIRQKYWPISGRASARKICRNCVICFRASPRHITPQMGQLPSFRVSQAPVFYHCGTDYAGPFTLKASHLRGAKTYKVWIVVFVCMSTKAIHLELVTSLTTDGFISSLRRFISRRGKPRYMYSDTGTNYVGANNELQELYRFIKTTSDDLMRAAECEEITWNFIPSRSPHFGGLWEAGVKSIKHHLKRITTNITFTFEEYYTILTQIEAILNARPLSTLSSDPNDLAPLTPAHFLIGRPMLSIPEESDYSLISLSRLNRYQHIQLLVQHFWKRWSAEYLNNLQVRTKWKAQVSTQKIEVGTVVLMANDSLPCTKWALGRIVDVHPGKDGAVRTVTLKTSGGTTRRAVTKICPLPIDGHNDTTKTNSDDDV